MEISQLARALWRRKAIFALTWIVVIAAAAIFTAFVPREYDSTSTLTLTPRIAQGGVTTSPAGDSMQALIGTYAQVAESEAIREAAGAELGEPIRASIEASTQTGNNLILIQARAGGPDKALADAEAVTQAFEEELEDNRIFETELITPPERPDAATVPNVPLNMGVAILIGAVLATLVALAFDRLFYRVASPQEAGSLLGAPVIGRLPNMRRFPTPTETSPSTPEEATWLEGVRTLRTNVSHLVSDRSGSQALLVTSATPGQGKSAIAAALAVSYAQAGVDTILVDGDLQHPAQHRTFGLPKEPGLSNWGDDDVVEPGTSIGGEYLKPVAEVDGLRVLTAGPHTSDSADRIEVRFSSLLGSLQQPGRMIIIDGPPLLPSADARVMTTIVRGLVLVSSVGREKPTALRSAADSLDLLQAGVLGVVSNRVSRSRTPYGAYGSG